MRKLIVVTVVLGLVSMAGAATTFINLNGDIAVADNWDNGLPSAGNVGTLNIDATRESDVDMDGWYINQTDGYLDDTYGGYGAREIIGGTIFDVQGGTYARTNSLRITASTLKVSGGDALVNGIVGFDTGADGNGVIDVSAGNFISAGLINFNMNNAAPFTVNVSGGTAVMGVDDNDFRGIDEPNVAFNLSGGSLRLNALNYGGGDNDTNIVVTMSGDASLVTDVFNGNNNLSTEKDQYINFATDASDASWEWTAGGEEAAFTTLWNNDFLRHNGTGGSGGATFSEHFQVTGNTISAKPPTTFTNLNSDIAVAANWDNGLPDSADNVGTLNKNATRASDVDMDGWHITQTGGDLYDPVTNYRHNEIMGGTIFDVQGGTYSRTGASLRVTASTLKVSGGDVEVNGIVGFHTGADGSGVIDVSAGNFRSAKLINFNMDNAAPFTVNVSGGTVVMGVDDTDWNEIDEPNVAFNLSGGSLRLHALNYGDGDDDTNIVITISGDASFVTDHFNGNGNLMTQPDRYIDFATDASDASWKWIGTNEAAFVTLWNSDFLRHNGTGGSGGAFFSDHFQVTGDTVFVIPEPAVIGMIGLFGIVTLFRRKIFAKQ